MTTKEFIDIEKCNGKPREEEQRRKVEIYVPSDSEEEFDPIELVNIAKPPPSHFIWPPPSEEEKFPASAPLYVAPPETQRITVKPCSYRPLEKPIEKLSVQNLRQVASHQTTSTEYECLNVESNITATTTSTSNASSESDYKMYQTQNNHYANMFEQTREVDDEVEEINQKPIVDLRKTPPPIELPKNIKHVDFVEPESTYKAETFSSVFSNRKETWQKLTSSSVVTKTELRVETTDVNPEKSDDDQNREIHVEENPDNDVENEIKGLHAGPYDGTYYQLPPSNIPQPTPKCYLTDFHRALITTSDRPYSIGDIAPTPEPKLPNLDFYEEAVKEAQNYPYEEPPKPKKTPKKVPQIEVKTTPKSCEFPYEDQDVRRGSLMCSMVRTASPQPMKFVKSNIIEEIHLPEESDAYFPDPISMEPNEPYPELDSYRTKSPFVGALTTGPDRPYTPFGREIMSQLSMDLPARKITFSNALQTAPDDSFDPSSLEYEYDPTEYTAKVYERISVEVDADDRSSTSSAFAKVTGSSVNRSFLPSIQPWSVASEQIVENTYTDSFCCQEAAECFVTESRRGSETQGQGQRRRSSVVTQCPCDSRRCSEAPQKQLSDLLKTKIHEEEEFDPDKPNPNAVYPKRGAPSPFEGMQVKVTNKNTANLHKADDIPTYQRKWFNLPTQNPSKTPEPEELRENVPMAFHDWPATAQNSRCNSISASDYKSKAPTWMNVQISEPTRVSIAEVGMSAKPPIPADIPSASTSRRNSISDMKREARKIAEEAEDAVGEILFPTVKIIQAEGGFPTVGKRKNSLIDIEQTYKTQFAKQKDLRHELQQQQQKLVTKNKQRQQKEIDMMHQCAPKTPEASIREEIQQNPKLSAYEQEQEYKRQLELERQQRQKEKELKEQKAREVEYQRQMEESRQHEIKLKENRERDLQQETQREMEYQKIRNEQEEVQRRQQAERDLELSRQQEDIETEIRRQQEREKRMTEARESQRLFEIRRKEERDRELEKIEKELRAKREDELIRLEKEIREKREQKRREEHEADERKKKLQLEEEEADRELRRLQHDAELIQRDRDQKLQQELKFRKKQEADRKQREEFELFNIEEERSKQVTYSSHTYQQQTVWPPTCKSTTPALQMAPRQIPIIKTESETELNATKFRFEPLDEDQRRFMAGIRPPSTCYSPPSEDKPYPAIPYYQQHLVFVEKEANHCGVFDPKALSPTPNRSRSPAFGPPPNPLLAFVNKPRDPELDESGIYLCGERLLSPVWYNQKNKQIPPAVQRKIHPLGGASRPPSKPDIAALCEAVRKHKLETASKAAPTPPPMPKIRPIQTSQKKAADSEQKEVSSTEFQIPKGIVASQVRRLSGDASNPTLFSTRSSTAHFENSSQSFPTYESEARPASRQIDFYDNRQESSRQTMTNNFTASASTSSSHQITNNSSQSYNQQFMGQSLASASFQNSQMNPSSVDNVRVSAGSVGAPGALPKHGRTFTTSGPNRGQGILTQPSTGRVPICGGCALQVRLVMGFF